jgi:hypothetical protein
MLALEMFELSIHLVLKCFQTIPKLAVGFQSLNKIWPKGTELSSLDFAGWRQVWDSDGWAFI